jgi:putative ABC transport system permease protein
MRHLVQDVRFALRTFVRAPRFTVPAVLALALGIGATSAIFSVVRGVMLKPLPYRDPDRIVSIFEMSRTTQSRAIVASANFVEWRERNRSFEYLGMVGPSRLTVLLNGQPLEVTGQTASADVFLALGVQAAQGRTFTPDEDLQGNDAVILLGHELWQSRLAGRSDVVGSTIDADGRKRMVVGVMAPGFTIEGQRADFYITYGWTTERLRAAIGRGNSHAVARLRDGVMLKQASDEMAIIAAQREKEAPRLNAGRSVVVLPIHAVTVESVKPALLVLSVAVVLVLLIACVNVANLLLARSTVRQRELGLRTALGAGRGRLLRQMLTESLMLSLAGGLAGLGLAFLFHRGLLALVADRMPVPRLDQVSLDLPAVGFTAITALATGVLFGLVPALLASASANDALREGGRHGAGPRARRTLSALVVVEVALSLVLLTGAGLLIRSFVRLQNVNPGFRAEDVLTARVSLPGVRYPQPRDSVAFFDNALGRIRALPGVQSAAGVAFLPMAGPGIGTRFYRLDRPVPADGQAPSTQVRPVTPGSFRTLGIPQRAGRDFTEADREDSPAVAIVSEGAVKLLYPGEDPIGKRLQVNARGAKGQQVEIVGVVADIKMGSLDTETRAAVYLPHSQLSMGQMTFVARTGVPPLSLATAVAGVLRSIDPEVALADVRSMEEVVATTLARPRAISVLLTAFALMALVLAAVGVYGVMAYSVSQRTREIGVRMALGATADAVFRMVLGHALRLVALGVAGGLVAAAGLTRMLETLLFQTGPLDAATFGVTALVLIVVATLASFIPARRCTRITPVEALRTE